MEPPCLWHQSEAALSAAQPAMFYSLLPGHCQPGLSVSPRLCNFIWWNGQYRPQLLRSPVSATRPMASEDAPTAVLNWPSSDCWLLNMHDSAHWNHEHYVTCRWMSLTMQFRCFLVSFYQTINKLHFVHSCGWMKSTSWLLIASLHFSNQYLKYYTHKPFIILFIEEHLQSTLYVLQTLTIVI